MPKFLKRSIRSLKRSARKILPAVESRNASGPDAPRPPGRRLAIDGVQYRIFADHAVVIGREGTSSKINISASVGDVDVTAVNRGAFNDDANLAAVSLPATLTSIGSEAFRGCTALEKVELPAGLEVVNHHAFSGCSSLRQVHLPFMLRRIGHHAFEGCTRLETLPHFVMTGPRSEARVARKLVEMSFPINLEYIGEAAFQGCASLRRINIPYRVNSVPPSSFAGCSSLETVWLHSEVTSIGAEAFADCASLTAVRIPSSLTEIGENAFSKATALIANAGSLTATQLDNDAYTLHAPDSITHGVTSQFGAPEADRLTALLNDPEALKQIVSYYEVRPPMDSVERDNGKTFETLTTPSRFRWSDGVYRATDVDETDPDVSIAMVGDLMCGARQQRQATIEGGAPDFAPQLQHVRSVLTQSDLSIGNLETTSSSAYPYTSERQYAEDRPHLNAPTEFLSAVRSAGFDVAMSAQNHMYDSGVTGILQTLQGLNEAQLIHGGLFAGPDEPRHLMFEIKGMKIAIVGYLDPARQRMKQVNFTAEGLDAMASLFSAERVQRDIAEARNAGAEFVLAYAHWGAEFTARISRRQADFAHLLVDAGADYIFGSHSHCLQRYEVLEADDGRQVPVVYSGGNFLSDIRRRRPITQDTLISSLTLTRDPEGRVVIKGDGYVPCRILDETRAPTVTVVPCEDLANGMHDFEMSEAREDAQRISRTLGATYTPIRVSHFRSPDAPEPRPSDFAVPVTPLVSEAEAAPNEFGSNPLAQLRKEPLESALIEAQTLSFGLTSNRFTATLFSATGSDGAQMAFRRAGSSLSSIVGSEFCADKAVCKALLQANGIPTAVGLKMPRNGVLSAKKFVAQHGWPVVVKPRKGSGGRGVTANIRDEESLKLAIREADAPGGFLIEKHVPGEDYRFLVSGDEVIGVWRRDAANVVGDGRETVSTLIDRKNQVRARNPHLASRPILKNSLVKNHLAQDGRDLQYIPARGEKVYLRSAANLSSGGDNIEITAETHPSLKEIAVRAKKLLPSIELVGIDFLMEDHRLSAEEQSVNICEINSSPGISAHDFPMFGPVRPAARKYVERIAALSNIVLALYRAQGDFILDIRGSFDGTGFEQFVREKAEQAGVEMAAIETTPESSTVSFSGTTVAAAVLNCELLSPRAQDARVESTTLRFAASA